MAPFNVHPSPTEESQTINIQLNYMKIVDVEETIEQVDLVIVYEMMWVDYRLKWDPKEFMGIEYIFVYPRRIWMPDISIYSNNGFQDERTEAQRIVKVDHNGSMLAVISASTEIVCSIDIRDMPFDTQECQLALGSYSVRAQVNLTLPFDLTAKDLIMALHLMVSNVTALAFILNILSESLPKTKNVPYLAQNVYVDLSLTLAAYLIAMIRRPIIWYIIKRWISPKEEKNNKA
ncbi:hypothetical protein WR25_02719 [Diploscapter pachys]|uniref:Neurotransmitter-gated ion-channel ligand-binding domain-containing protein n=1 Tax=Diploscapter pachys TaxID=2018661 RepID=A0A2A2J7K8_9BILA|nr:hypothetical protein WR25_02719 [Diploscapter pachys]